MMYDPECQCQLTPELEPMLARQKDSHVLFIRKGGGHFSAALCFANSHQSKGRIPLLCSLSSSLEAARQAALHCQLNFLHGKEARFVFVGQGHHLHSHGQTHGIFGRCASFRGPRVLAGGVAGEEGVVAVGHLLTCGCTVH